MSSTTYFISDLHLDASRPHITAALATFLDRIAGCDALYILGDLFEAWVGDDDDAPMAIETQSLLRCFADSGAALYLLHGNRDFLIQSRFAARTGATLLGDPSRIDLYGTPTLLLHGDTLCSADTDYQAYRQQARDADWQAEVMARPLHERRVLAGDLRRASKEALSRKPEDIGDVCTDTVRSVAAEHAVGRMIHGHTHRPARHEETFGERWVLGDWDTQGWSLEASPAGLSLQAFPIAQSPQTDA